MLKVKKKKIYIYIYLKFRGKNKILINFKTKQYLKKGKERKENMRKRVKKRREKLELGKNGIRGEAEAASAFDSPQFLER